MGSGVFISARRVMSGGTARRKILMNTVLVIVALLGWSLSVVAIPQCISIEGVCGLKGTGDESLLHEGCCTSAGLCNYPKVLARQLENHDLPLGGMTSNDVHQMRRNVDLQTRKKRAALVSLAFAEEVPYSCDSGCVPASLDCCPTITNITLPLVGTSVTTGKEVAIAQLFPFFLQPIVHKHCERASCLTLRGVCRQIILPRMVYVINSNAKSPADHLLTVDFVYVESGCECQLDPLGMLDVSASSEVHPYYPSIQSLPVQTLPQAAVGDLYNDHNTLKNGKPTHTSNQQREKQHQSPEIGNQVLHSPNEPRMQSQELYPNDQYFYGVQYQKPVETNNYLQPQLVQLPQSLNQAGSPQYSSSSNQPGSNSEDYRSLKGQQPRVVTTLNAQYPQSNYPSGPIDTNELYDHAKPNTESAKSPIAHPTIISNSNQPQVSLGGTPEQNKISPDALKLEHIPLPSIPSHYNSKYPQPGTDDRLSNVPIGTAYERERGSSELGLQANKPKIPNDSSRESINTKDPKLQYSEPSDTGMLQHYVQPNVGKPESLGSHVKSPEQYGQQASSKMPVKSTSYEPDKSSIQPYVPNSQENNYVHQNPTHYPQSIQVADDGQSVLLYTPQSAPANYGQYSQFLGRQNQPLASGGIYYQQIPSQTHQNQPIDTGNGYYQQIPQQNNKLVPQSISDSLLHPKPNQVNGQPLYSNPLGGQIQNEIPSGSPHNTDKNTDMHAKYPYTNGPYIEVLQRNPGKVISPSGESTIPYSIGKDSSKQIPPGSIHNTKVDEPTKPLYLTNSAVIDSNDKYNPYNGYGSQAVPLKPNVYSPYPEYISPHGVYYPPSQSGVEPETTDVAIYGGPPVPRDGINHYQPSIVSQYGSIPSPYSKYTSPYYNYKPQNSEHENRAPKEINVELTSNVPYGTQSELNKPEPQYQYIYVDPAKNDPYSMHYQLPNQHAVHNGNNLQMPKPMNSNYPPHKGPYSQPLVSYSLDNYPNFSNQENRIYPQGHGSNTKPVPLKIDSGAYNPLHSILESAKPGSDLAHNKPSNYYSEQGHSKVDPHQYVPEFSRGKPELPALQEVQNLATPVHQLLEPTDGNPTHFSSIPNPYQDAKVTPQHVSRGESISAEHAQLNRPYETTVLPQEYETTTPETTTGQIHYKGKPFDHRPRNLPPRSLEHEVEPLSKGVEKQAPHSLNSALYKRDTEYPSILVRKLVPDSME